MKKILFCFFTLVCLLLASGCGKDKEEAPAPPVSTTSRQPVQDYTSRQYTLTYTAGENGAIAGVSPQNVGHGGDGSPVTAVPAEHHHFTGWSDGVGTASRIDRKVTADLAVTAIFAIDQHKLTYTADQGGVIDGAATQMVDHGGSGTLVRAVPAAGYHFLRWSDGVSTSDRADSGVVADLAVTASFAVNQYTLTYITGENGAIDGISPQTVVHGGDGRSVTAVPAAHYHFTGWSDGVATANRADRQVTADLTVTATFAIDRYALTYTAAEHGSIVGVSSQAVAHGGDGSTVTAVPADGYHFEGWSDGVDTPSRTDSKVTANLAVTANFAINRYTLTYVAEENGTIGGAGSQTVLHGDDAGPVTAVADKGYHFLTWSDGVTTAQRIDTMVMGDLTVSAVFAVNTYAVGGSVSGLVSGTEVVLQNNGGDDLAVSTNGAFKFTTELLNASNYEVRVLTQPTRPNQTCTVTSGTGTIPEADFTAVKVTCIPVTYTIGGKVSGLPAGDQVVLRNNGGDYLTVNANGTFTFVKPLDDGSAYKVEVYRQLKRPNWTCEAEKAAGNLQGMSLTDVDVYCFPKVILKTTAGKNKIKLNWNSQDFSEATFNLCQAREEIPRDGFGNCQALKGGVFKKQVTDPLIVSQPAHDIPHWFQLEASYASGRQTLSEVVIGMSFGGLNDTGIDWCTDGSRERAGTRAEKSKSCAAFAATHPGQDAVYGRDAAARTRKLSKTGTGSAGFDFTRVCRSGEAAGEGKCPPNPVPGSSFDNWACTRDNATGLLWEIKMDSGLRGKNNSYTWFNPEATVNGGEAGLKNGGSCVDIACDTQAYVQAINDLGLCGVSDWRLPTKRELLSIVDNGLLNPAIDSRFFPNTLSSNYWSSLPSADQNNSAWQVYFRFGEASPNKKSQRNHLRLVRGRTITFGLDNP
jgi:hypothetical protein